MRIRTSAILVLGLFVAVLAASAAPAQDRRPPTARLSAGGVTKALRPWSVDWVRRRGGKCVGQSGDGVPRFRPRVKVGHRRVAPKVAFEGAHRPRRVRAFASRRLVNGFLGPSDRVKVGLRKRRVQGHGKAWTARIPVKVKRRLFVEVIGVWRDTEGCGGREDAAWSFALARR